MTSRIRALTALCLTLALLCASASAELTVVKDSLVFFDGENTATYSALVENTGTAPAAPDAGTLTLFGPDGAAVLSESYVPTIPDSIVLQPGESVIVSYFLWSSALQDGAVTAWTYTPAEWSADYARPHTIIPCSSEIRDAGDGLTDIVVTFTNDTDGVLSNFVVTAAVLAEDGSLMLTESEHLHALGLEPGATVPDGIAIRGRDAADEDTKGQILAWLAGLDLEP